jgi:S1-C subfamily serine protease
VYVLKKLCIHGVIVGALFLGVPAIGDAQSTGSMQLQIDHLNRCTDLEKQSIYLDSGAQSTKEMIDYKKGILTFGSEDLKTDMIQKVETLERENSTSDLEELKRKLLTKSLEVARTIEADCSDTDHDKSSRSVRLLEIGGTLTDLDQAEDALPIFRRCMALNPDFAPCSESMGMALLHLGRRSEARETFNRTVEIGGFNEWNAKYIESAKQMLAMLDREDEDSKGLAVSEEPKPTQHAFGTGFFVSSDGEILTNNHVVAGCRYLRVNDGPSVQIISRDPASDLALVKVDLKPDQIAVFRSGPVSRIGDTVVTFGFPLPGILSSQGNVSTGVLSATTGLGNDIRFVQISAPVQPGNSGGPVFDTSGHVIGVVVAKLDALRVAQFTGDFPQNVNFAVHWSEVRALLDEQGVRYRKLPSQHAINTRDIAKIGAGISVMLDCVQ